ncbi:uncharacterized protein LOC133683001 [Populus nigra]|uniref:uncharacterized protein LOC133683001 n=1 Tax=Populus nigra TaxID=3691 RepID=UPI002B26CA52|nr:uncharacterized protein LOC133683001 [Populus nigra]
MKFFNEEKAKRFKALTCLHNAVSKEIFTRIMACKSAKETWDKLKVEFHGDEKSRKMQVLNLRRQFEGLKMRETDTIKDFSSQISKLVNQVRLLGEDFPDSRIVEKVLPWSKDKLIDKKEQVKELLLQFTRRRVGLRIFTETSKKKKKKKGEAGNSITGNRTTTTTSSLKGKRRKNIFLLANSVRKQIILKPGVGSRMHNAETEMYNTAKANDSSWLIDSGCTNHMTADLSLFKDLDKSYLSRVRIRNGDYVKVEGKGTIEVETLSASDGVALTLFDQVEHKDDVVLWSAMASIFVKNGKYREGIDCFRRNAELQCGG